MTKRSTLILLLIVLLTGSTAQAQTATDLFDAVLAEVVTDDGLVRYDLLDEGQVLQPVLEAFAAEDAAELEGDAARNAFWINAYNAHMMAMVAERPRRKNILRWDLGRVFFRTERPVGGVDVSLDDIEHGMLRKGTDRPELIERAPSRMDPRLHVAVNCAAISCPRLWPEAFRADGLDEQLDLAMRTFANAPDKVGLDGDRLVLSKLLDWYGDDFDEAGMPAGDWLLSYMSTDRPDFTALQERLAGRTAQDLKDEGARYEYDWTVNRAR